MQPDSETGEQPTEPEPEESGEGMLEGVLAKLAPAWRSFAEDVRALDCKPARAQLEIDGLVYTSEKWAASTGLEIGARLVTLLGPGLAAALGTGEIGAIGIDVLVSVAQAAASAGLIPLAMDTLSSMSVNKLARGNAGRVCGTVRDFDRHFAGEYEHLGRVVIFALVHNLRGPTYGAR